MNRSKKIKGKKAQLNKPVPTLNLVDYSEMNVPLIVVYNSPADFPGKIIARVWEGMNNRPTNVYCEYKNVAECERDIMSAGFVMNFPRNAEDDECIIGTYMR